ncbi:hypothetical protein TNCV_3735641 [Trichonephila clavipes]|nr:hypothetical protein TNCV_3735641 [Trichonephila clavipes]
MERETFLHPISKCIWALKWRGLKLEGASFLIGGLEGVKGVAPETASETSDVMEIFQRSDYASLWLGVLKLKVRSYPTFKSSAIRASAFKSRWAAFHAR